MTFIISIEEMRLRLSEPIQKQWWNRLITVYQHHVLLMSPHT